MPCPTSQGFRGQAPEINGLRAIAAISVIYTHAAHETLLSGRTVLFFYVLTGFLIASQLSSHDQDFLRERCEWKGRLRRFYTSRVFRLFPAYFGVLFVAWLCDIGGMRQAIWWHILFGSNIWFTIQNNYVFPIYHLWSLSVQEQFYLIFPILCIVLRQKQLMLLCAAAILAAILLRAWLIATDPRDPGLFLLLPLSLDSFGWGALIALLQRRGQVPGWLFGAGAAVAIADAGLYLSFGRWWQDGNLASPGLRLAESLPPFALAVLILRASQGLDGLFGAVLRHRWLGYLGRISFGIYLYHLFVIAAVLAMARAAGMPQHLGNRVFVVSLCGTVLLAILSWETFERRLYDLRTRFAVLPPAVPGPGLGPLDQAQKQSAAP